MFRTDRALGVESLGPIISIAESLVFIIDTSAGWMKTSHKYLTVGTPQLLRTIARFRPPVANRGSSLRWLSRRLRLRGRRRARSGLGLIIHEIRARIGVLVYSDSSLRRCSRGIP
jgi:hypothetical protein